MHPNLITVLQDRLLLANGVSVVEPEQVPDLFVHGLQPSQIQVTEETPDVVEFNRRSSELLQVFDEHSNLTLPPNDWLIPQEYLELDLFDYFAIKLSELSSTASADDMFMERAEARVANELEAVRQFKFENGLRTIIYVTDTFRKHNQVWGVGRGSSCASYLLFLIGIHCVDCLKFDIHWSEFFHS